MLGTLLVGAAIAMSGSTTDAGAQATRAFLMLDGRSVEFVDGAPVVGTWQIERRRGDKHPVEVIDGVQFVVDKEFWKMIKENELRRSAKADVRIEEDGRLVFRDKAVDIGMRIGALGPVLRWHDWIVALGTSADPAQETIKGSFWYLLWFGEKSLRGSHRRVVTVGMPVLRIYTK
jgi:hypothetical protein